MGTLYAYEVLFLLRALNVIIGVLQKTVCREAALVSLKCTWDFCNKGCVHTVTVSRSSKLFKKLQVIRYYLLEAVIKLGVSRYNAVTFSTIVQLSVKFMLLYLDATSFASVSVLFFGTPLGCRKL